MKKNIRNALGVLLVIVAALVAWHLLAEPGRATGSNTEDRANTVAAVRTIRGTLAHTITLTAEFRPYQQIDVHAKVAGFIQSIPVDIGDRVKAGDVLATLEIPELQEDLKRSAAALGAAREGVKQAEATYQAVHDVFTRLQQVAKDHPKLVAQQEIEDASSKDQGAAAGLASAKQHVEEAQADQSRETAMVDYSKITAPFDGVITKRFADVGSLIQAGTSSSTQATAVVSLAQENVLRAMFPVPESAVSAIHEGAAVRIDITGLGRTVQGTVTRFSRQLNRETRTMEAEVDVPNEDLSITAGMYGWAMLTLEEHKNALNVPVEAIATGANPTVYLIDKNNQIQERSVTTGMETPNRVEILSGLQQNDLIFLGNRGQVHPGMKVTPKVEEVAQANAEEKNG